MSVEENKAFIRRFLAKVSGKDKPAETVNEYVADEGLRQHIALLGSAFPRYEFIIDDMIAEGDKVVIRSTFKGTHKGELMGIAPTGKEVTESVIIIYRIANGKIVENWISYDQLSLMQQLGVIPPMGQSKE